jgi:hypothetical protein
MKSTLVKILLAIGSVTLAVTISASAQPIVAGHYPAGAEGIKGASLPPREFISATTTFSISPTSSKISRPILRYSPTSMRRA